MKDRLIEDYLFKSEVRIKALEFYLQSKDYPDVIREAQEVVELLLKALLRSLGIEAPKIHDVSKTIELNLDKMPEIICDNIALIKKISKALRKERELCFYGADDFIPTEEYSFEEASEAINQAKIIFDIVQKSL